MTLGNILLLILSTLASTPTIQARWAVRGQTAATGLVQQAPERMHTSWNKLFSNIKQLLKKGKIKWSN